jgi:hypothetical protein
MDFFVANAIRNNRLPIRMPNDRTLREPSGANLPPPSLICLSAFSPSQLRWKHEEWLDSRFREMLTHICPGLYDD